MPYVDNQGVRIYYELDGDGPPLVLQHGLSDSCTSWREFGYVARLGTQYRLIMIEARGHGRSDKPHEPAAYEWARRASDVIAVLDALDVERADFFGYSMGGRIGFALAKHAPERLNSLLIGGNHPYPADMTSFRQVFRRGLRSWIEILDKAAGPLSFLTRERLAANDIEALRASVAEDTPDLSAPLVTLPLHGRLFVGGDDPRQPLVTRCANEMLKAQLFVLPDLNHFQTFLRGDLVAPLILEDVIRFLEKVPRPAHRTA